MTDPNPALPPVTDTETTRLQAEIDKWKALSRKHEDQSKKHATELSQLKAAGDATKSDMDKVMAKLDAAEKRSQEAERRALHGEVVAATGLSFAKVARLQGETVEELITDAETVFDWKPKADDGAPAGEEGKTPAPASTPVATRPPKERLTGAPGVMTEPEEKDPRKLAAQIPRMYG
jgi:hypothetical protein